MKKGVWGKKISLFLAILIMFSSVNVFAQEEQDKEDVNKLGQEAEFEDKLQDEGVSLKDEFTESENVLSACKLEEECQVEDSCDMTFPIIVDVLYYDKGISDWNTQNNDIPVIRNFTDFGIDGQEEMKMRVSVDFCELVWNYVPLHTDEELEGISEGINSFIKYIEENNNGMVFSADTNFSINIELPKGLKYNNNNIDFNMEQGSLFKIKDKAEYNEEKNIITVPITFSNEYKGSKQTKIEFLEDLKKV